MDNGERTGDTVFVVIAQQGLEVISIIHQANFFKTLFTGSLLKNTNLTKSR